MRVVQAAAERAGGRRLPTCAAPRRAGDLPALVAEIGRIRSVLARLPRRDTPDPMVRGAIAWEGHPAATPA